MGSRPLAGLLVPVEALAFWLAALLPAVYLPLSMVRVDEMPVGEWVLVLLTVHLVALFLGHRYRQRA